MELDAFFIDSEIDAYCPICLTSESTHSLLCLWTLSTCLSVLIISLSMYFLGGELEAELD